eukprot:Tbor_TRINITY_DN5256_c3_g3::TRINITY_DN5256_c3_g3_i1::g.16062::m.16062
MTTNYEIVDDITIEPETPEEELLLACRYADIPKEEILLFIQQNKHPLDLVNCSDAQGRTPIHMSSANGHEEITKVLVDCGATPNIRNKEGCTALHYAAVNNHCGVANILINSGWKASVRDYTGKLPITLIYDKGFEDMEVLLLKCDDSLGDESCLPEGAVLNTRGVVDSEECV